MPAFIKYSRDYQSATFRDARAELICHLFQYARCDVSQHYAKFSVADLIVRKSACQHDCPVYDARGPDIHGRSSCRILIGVDAPGAVRAHLQRRYSQYS